MLILCPVKICFRSDLFMTIKSYIKNIGKKTSNKISKNEQKCISHFYIGPTKLSRIYHWKISNIKSFHKLIIFRPCPTKVKLRIQRQSYYYVIKLNKSHNNERFIIFLRILLWYYIKFNDTKFKS